MLTRILIALTIVVCIMPVMWASRRFDAPAPVAASAPTPRANPSENSLRVLTYNVLADDKDAARRLPVLLNIVGKADADILAFQEVQDGFRERLLQESWAANYPYSSDAVSSDCRGSELWILSKHPLLSARRVRLPGPQGRSVLVAKLTLYGRPLSVATMHMESYLEDGAVRAKQLDRIFELLKVRGDALLAGDFNFGDGEAPDTAHLHPAFADAWKSSHPSEPGYTWNIEVSEMARAGSFKGERSRRIDRILVRSDAWRPVDAQIVGNAPVTPGDRTLFPSDHFGLTARLELARK
ncbi:MAG: endonuclease/exonuclease/phosphatase family protein [Planctomycetes bacterium]|nr:endonuclease/exonuclease/phosphatase family protein [Planctomycetota bacterium]